MMKNKKIIAIIPARGGSKRITEKNIKFLTGKPLIAYTIEKALKGKYLDRVIVSTEDKKIAEISRKYGAEVIKRPKKLARDNSPVIDAVAHVLSVLERENYIPSTIVLLQPTSPLRTVETINRAIKIFLSKSNSYDSLIPLCPVAKKVGKIKGGCYVPEYILGSRHQDLEQFYRECGTIFIFKPNFIKKGKMFGKRIFPFVIKNYEGAIDIDDINEFKEAEYFIKQKQ